MPPDVLSSLFPSAISSFYEFVECNLLRKTPWISINNEGSRGRASLFNHNVQSKDGVNIPLSTDPLIVLSFSVLTVRIEASSASRG